MLFDIPLYASPKFSEFIERNPSSIYSVYYRIPETPRGMDARNFRTPDLESDQVLLSLCALPDAIRKFGLLNTRVVSPAFYESDEGSKLVSIITRLHEEGLLDGLIATDFMYLHWLATALPSEVVRTLEVVPSVNMGIHNIAQAQIVLSYITSLGFSLPSEIILDRSINRQPRILENFRQWQQKTYPLMKVTLLVNEGCLPHCPIKVSHDCLISYFNQADIDNDLPLNVFRKHGCKGYIEDKFYYYLTSPILRPEDIAYIEPHFDVIKIAGRTHSENFIFQCINAYKARRWAGNLLEIIDTAYPIREKCFIDNDRIPSDFYLKTSTCTLDCDQCGYCQSVYTTVAR